MGEGLSVVLHHPSLFVVSQQRRADLARIERNAGQGACLGLPNLQQVFQPYAKQTVRLNRRLQRAKAAHGKRCCPMAKNRLWSVNLKARQHRVPQPMRHLRTALLQDLQRCGLRRFCMWTSGYAGARQRFENKRTLGLGVS